MEKLKMLQDNRLSKQYIYIITNKKEIWQDIEADENNNFQTSEHGNGVVVPDTSAGKNVQLKNSIF
jgi:hypothetical protein